MSANDWKVAFVVGAVVVFVATALLWSAIARSRAAHATAVAMAVALSALHQLAFRTSAEDAFITYRYAENFAQGRGLVFNVGERVEGYSNFLWTVLIAAPRAVFGTSVESTARVGGFVLTLVLVVLVHQLARMVSGDPRAAVVAALLTAVSGTVAAYGPAGLESPLFAVLVVVSLMALLADRLVLAGVVLGLVVMTRPDGVLFIAVAMVWIVLRQDGALLPRLRPWVRLLVPAALLLVPWTVWRIVYYGHLVPNAMSAKAGGSLRFQLRSGIDYVGSFLFSYQSLVVLVVAAVAVMWLTDRRRLLDRRGPLVLVAGALAVPLGFAVAVGGDWMPAYRFLYLVPPLAAVVVTPAVAQRATRGPSAGPSRATLIVVLTVAAFLVATSIRDVQMIPRVREWSAQVDQLTEIGSWFHDALPQGTEVAVFANGALSFAAGGDLVMIDVLGLTDEHIAREGDRAERGTIGHLANDWPYVVERAPAVTYLGGGGFEDQPVCSTNPLLGDSYRPAPFRVVGAGAWVNLWLRADVYDETVARLSGDARFAFEPCPSS